MTSLPRAYLVLALVMLLGASLRLINLGEESLWLDEARGINRAAGDLGELTAWRTQDPNPPLYYILLKPWVGLLGTSEWAARSFSVVFGVLCIPVIFLVARTLFDERTGLLSSFIASITIFQIQYSQEARMYSLLSFLSLVSVYAFLQLTRDGGRREVALYLVASCAMIYTHIYGLFVLIFQNAWMLSLCRDRVIWKRWIALQVVVFLAFTPWLPGFAYQVGNPSTQSWIPCPDPGTLYQSIAAYLGGREWRMVLFVSLAVLGVFSFRKLSGRLELGKPLGSLSTYSWNVKLADTRSLLTLLLWTGALFALPVAISLLVTPIFVTRYAIVASFPLYILVARSARFLPGRNWSLAIALAILVASAPSMISYYREDQKEQWREVSLLIGKNAAEGEPVFINPPSWIEPFLYYFEEEKNTAYPLSENEGEVSWVDRTVVTPDTIGPIIEEVDGFWTVVAYSGRGYPKEHLDFIASPQLVGVFTELYVFHYEK